MRVASVSCYSRKSVNGNVICGWTESSRWQVEVNNNVGPFNWTNSWASQLIVKQGQSQREGSFDLLLHTYNVKYCLFLCCSVYFTLVLFCFTRHCNVPMTSYFYLYFCMPLQMLPQVKRPCRCICMFSPINYKLLIFYFTGAYFLKAVQFLDWFSIPKLLSPFISILQQTWNLLWIDNPSQQTIHLHFM